MRLWLSVEEVAPYTGDDPQAIYRDIREAEAGGPPFPWEYVRLGRRIKISARSLGLIPNYWDPDGPQFKPIPNSEEQPQGEVLHTAA